jgi:hypothetical protein
MEPATFIAISERRAVLEAPSSVPIYSNLLLRLEAMPGEEEVPELYAKVIRPLDPTSNRRLIQFTSVPPAVRVRLNGLAGQGGNSAVNSS